MKLEPKKKTDVQFNGVEKLSKSWMIPYRDNIDNEFNSRFNDIKSKFDELVDEVYWNNILYNKDICEINITPVVNNSYYLYQKNNGKFFISIISPDEWKMKKYIGSFKFLHTGKWLKNKF